MPPAQVRQRHDAQVARLQDLALRAPSVVLLTLLLICGLVTQCSSLSCYTANATIPANTTETISQDLDQIVPSACSRNIGGGMMIMLYTVENVTIEHGATLFVDVAGINQDCLDATFGPQIEGVDVLLRNVRVKGSAMLIISGYPSNSSALSKTLALWPFSITIENCSFVNGMLALELEMPRRCTTVVNGSVFNLSDVNASPLVAISNRTMVASTLMLFDVVLYDRSSVTIQDSAFVGTTPSQLQPPDGFAVGLAFRGVATLIVISGTSSIGLSIDASSALIMQDVVLILNATDSQENNTLYGVANGTALACAIAVEFDHPPGSQFGPGVVRIGAQSAWSMRRIVAHTTYSVLRMFNGNGSSSTVDGGPPKAAALVLNVSNGGAFSLDGCTFASASDGHRAVVDIGSGVVLSQAASVWINNSTLSLNDIGVALKPISALYLGTLLISQRSSVTINGSVFTISANATRRIPANQVPAGSNVYRSLIHGDMIVLSDVSNVTIANSALSVLLAAWSTFWFAYLVGSRLSTTNTTELTNGSMLSMTHITMTNAAVWLGKMTLAGASVCRMEEVHATCGSVCNDAVADFTMIDMPQTTLSEGSRLEFLFMTETLRLTDSFVTLGTLALGVGAIAARSGSQVIFRDIAITADSGIVGNQPWSFGNGASMIIERCSFYIAVVAIGYYGVAAVVRDSASMVLDSIQTQSSDFGIGISIGVALTGNGSFDVNQVDINRAVSAIEMLTLTIRNQSKASLRNIASTNASSTLAAQFDMGASIVVDNYSTLVWENLSFSSEAPTVVVREGIVSDSSTFTIANCSFMSVTSDAFLLYWILTVTQHSAFTMESVHMSGASPYATGVLVLGYDDGEADRSAYGIVAQHYSNATFRNVTVRTSAPMGVAMSMSADASNHSTIGFVNSTFDARWNTISKRRSSVVRLVGIAGTRDPKSPSAIRLKDDSTWIMEGVSVFGDSFLISSDVPPPLMEIAGHALANRSRAMYHGLMLYDSIARVAEGPLATFGYALTVDDGSALHLSGWYLTRGCVSFASTVVVGNASLLSLSDVSVQVPLISGTSATITRGIQFLQAVVVSLGSQLQMRRVTLWSGAINASSMLVSDGSSLLVDDSSILGAGSSVSLAVVTCTSNSTMTISGLQMSCGADFPCVSGTSWTASNGSTMLLSNWNVTSNHSRATLQVGQLTVTNSSHARLHENTLRAENLPPSTLSTSSASGTGADAGAILFRTVNISSGSSLELNQQTVWSFEGPCVALNDVTLASNATLRVRGGALQSTTAVSFAAVLLGRVVVSGGSTLDVVDGAELSLVATHNTSNIVRYDDYAALFLQSCDVRNASNVVVMGVNLSTTLRILFPSSANATTSTTMKASGMSSGHTPLSLSTGSTLVLLNNAVNVTPSYPQNMTKGTSAGFSFGPRTTYLACFSLNISAFGLSSNTAVNGTQCRSPDGVWRAGTTFLADRPVGAAITATCNRWGDDPNSLVWFPTGTLTTDECVPRPPTMTHNTSSLSVTAVKSLSLSSSETSQCTTSKSYTNSPSVSHSRDDASSSLSETATLSGSKRSASTLLSVTPSRSSRVSASSSRSGEVISRSNSHTLTATTVISRSTSLQLPVTNTQTLSCRAELLAYPNVTTTKLLTQSTGALVTLSLVDGGSSFAGWWCGLMAAGVPSAALGILSSASEFATITGVSAAFAGGRCNSVTVALRSTPATPRRGAFPVPLHLSSRAFGCYVVGGAGLVITAHYEADPLVPPAAEDAAEGAVVVVALPVGSLGGSGVASGMQRALLQLRLASCDFDLTDDLDVASNPLRIGFGHADGRYLRGSVIGNVLSLVISAMVATVGAAIRRFTAYRQGRRMTLWRAGASLALPGWLVAPLAVLLQPLVSSSLSLVVHSDAMQGGGDVALGVFGLLSAAACAAVPTYLVTRGFGAVAIPLDASDSDCDGDDKDKDRILLAQLANRVSKQPGVRWVASYIRPRFEWRDMFEESLFTKRYRMVFEAYKPGRQWFVAVELWAAVATGLIGGVMPEDGGTCFRLLVALVVLNALLLVVMCTLRPFNSRADFIMSALMGAAATVWGAAALADEEELAAGVALVEVWLAVIALLLMVFQLLFTPRAARGAGRLVRLLERVQNMFSTTTRKRSANRDVNGSRCHAAAKNTGPTNPEATSDGERKHTLTRMQIEVCPSNDPERGTRLVASLVAASQLRSHGAALAQRLSNSADDATASKDALEKLVVMACVAGRQRHRRQQGQQRGGAAAT